MSDNLKKNANGEDAMAPHLKGAGMRTRLVQIDGALPNLALMKLASWHRSQGHEVCLTREVGRGISDRDFDLVYGSSIFQFSEKRRDMFQEAWPSAIVGGTGTDNTGTVEELIGGPWDQLDYSDYPEVDYSLGFTQRGCRLKCGFCVVPKKEGANRSTSTIAEIWRGPGHPKKLHLLDNDFFGQPGWRDRVAEIREGGFRICLSQGINVRLLDDDAAQALATIEYRDTKFERRRLYTAWDNLRDEEIFFAGVDRLERAGIPPRHLMVYMLIGFDPSETWDRIWHRFNRMVERGVKPYPMVFDRSRKDLTAFQRWVVMGLYRIVPFSSYNQGPQNAESILAYLLS